jgi:hypothetical protein
MRNILVVLSLLSSGVLCAQVPGYMGNRFSFFLEANPAPALLVQNINNEVIVNPGGDDARTYKVNKFAFNFRPQITFEYLIKRDLSLGVSYSRIGIGTVRGVKADPADTNEPFTEDLDVVKGQSIGLHFKFYQFDHSASIAPIGFYKTLSIYLTQTNTFDTKKSKSKLFQNEFLYPVVTFGFGRQAMIAKNLILKTGFELGWAFVPTNFFSETEEDWTVQEYAGYNVHQSLWGHYLFNFNVAIGYTPF